MKVPKSFTTLTYSLTALFVLAVAGVTLLRSPFGLAAAHSAGGSPLVDETAGRAVVINHFLDSFTGGTVPLAEYTGEVREFTLEIHKIKREIAPGVAVEQWAFAFPGEAPSVPGPELRVTEGDLVRVTLVNTHDQPHTLHFHGITSLAQGMDGVPHTSQQVLPGGSYTYEFVAVEAGTHAYHCHVQTYLHMDMGMYGALIVEPKGERVWNLEHTLVLDEWDSEQDPNAAIHDPDNDYYLVNGRAFPYVDPIRIRDGEVARVRVINMGYEPHALHLHGMSFLVVAKDGHELVQPYQGDTLPILPGERYDLLVKGRDGDFPFHDHIVGHVTNGGVYPGGMHLMVEGSPARSVSPESGSWAQAAPLAHTDTHGAHDHGDPAQHGVLMAGIATGAGGAEAPLQEGEVAARITGFAFDPPLLRVKAGTTVTWTNDDAVPHTVTEGAPGSEPAFDSGILAQGQSWRHTFTEPGEYDVYCLPHPFMTARVIVE